MEGKKQMGSSSSFTSDLFGSKESASPSSTGIFGSIFAPSSMVLGRESLLSEVVGKKQDSANDKSGVPDTISKSNEGESQSVPNKDLSFIYQEQKVQPCHLSSSIFYGGQDIYNHPQHGHNSSMNSTLKKDGTEDDTASRGNWWQGGPYY